VDRLREVLTHVVTWVRTFNRIVHYGAGLALLALLVLTIANIIGRDVFNSPVEGTVEVTPLLLVMVIYLGFAHAQHLGDHISVDLMYAHLGPRSQKASSVFSYIFTVVILVLLTRQLWRYAGVQERGGYTTASLEWEIHWFVRVATVGAALLLVATVVEIVAEVLGLDPDDTEAANGTDESVARAVGQEDQ
jgi:TRAP-type C4-dicarboxylate transport system permease small subunit